MKAIVFFGSILFFVVGFYCGKEIEKDETVTKLRECRYAPSYMQVGDSTYLVRCYTQYTFETQGSLSNK